MKSGDFVILTTEQGREVEAQIIVASTDGRALGLEFDAIINGWVGRIAVYQDDHGIWTAVTPDHSQVRIRPSPDMV